jgi:carbamoyltransferase
MKVLGINYLSESSITLIENGHITFAISQERINRKKNWWGNPIKSINFMLKRKKLKLSDIDYISTHGLIGEKNQKLIPSSSNFEAKRIEVIKSNLSKDQKRKQINFLNFRENHEAKVCFRTQKILKHLRKLRKKLFIYDHHKCHASSAYYFSGWKNCYVLTMDGWGDDSSSKFYKVNDNNFNLLSSSYTLDSIGYFYGSITKLLGFKPHQHEGKVLGLAAFGDPTVAYKDISKMISFDSLSNSFKGHYEKGIYQAKFENKNLNFLLKKYSKKDIAAATQKRLEDVVTLFINKNLPKKSKIALAGGIFANVKLNQKISENKLVEEIFVFPNMGDGGLSTGAAALKYFEIRKYSPKRIKNINLGPSFSNLDILKEIRKNKLNYIKIENPEFFIAHQLKKGKIIGLFQGKMEFGPRSLCNRSILVSAEDKKINNRLNKKLNRTEFMPFAPIILQTEAKKYFLSINSKKSCGDFMTSTFKCKKRCLKDFPAAVHVDQTARPQFINKDNKIIYKILNYYYKLTGSPAIINTSFNMHEEPIICSPADAIRAFKLGKLDYLFIGEYIIPKSQ